MLFTVYNPFEKAPFTSFRFFRNAWDYKCTKKVTFTLGLNLQGWETTLKDFDQAADLWPCKKQL